MNALEITELPDVVVNENTLIPVVNPDGAGRASLVNLRGLGIQNQETFFLVSSKNSGITSATAGWVETPEVTSSTNKYLWSYFKFTYTDGHVVETPPAIIGTHGEKGDAGTSDGTGGTSVTVDTDLSETSENPVQNKVITGAIGTLSDLTTTNKGNLVEAINEINANGGGSGGGTTGIVSQFTYVVDSDQALQDWADNVKENDYTNVLIKKGTWTVTKKLNLSNKTKTIVGEFGSKLVFDGCAGINYNSDESSIDRWMRNVHVECINGTAKHIGFQYCINLTDCSVKMISAFHVVGFTYCDNLVACQASCESTGNDSVGFSYSNYLDRCESVAEGLDDSVGSGYRYCNYLTNCKSKGTGLVNAYAFDYCNHLVNCEGEATGRRSDSRTAATSATRYCKYLVNHKSVSTVDEGSAFGYRYCEGLTNCIGTGTGTTGVVFKECKGLSRCRKHETSTTGVFSQSYASFSENATYVCADTPEGGFNDPTN